MMRQIDLLITEYTRYLKSCGQSVYTLKNVQYALRKFTRFLDETGIEQVEKITQELVEDYQQALCYSTGKSNQPLSLRTQSQLLGVLKGFTRFLKDRHCFVSDPAKDIQLPKKTKGLPQVILTSKEIKAVIFASNTSTYTGYRDRVILELLYDTAIRRAELSNIQIKHLDLESGFICIRGKGNKQRMVPVSGRVCELINNYIKMVRLKFIKATDTNHLILNRFGDQMNPNGIWAVVKRHAVRSGIKKNVSTHTFRHTCATHMMKNGAPVRHIQELLGHESLESTQIYTRVTINDLKAVHRKYHPGNHLDK